jgi:hypothetical protein
VRNDIRKLLLDTDAIAITSMYDYYKIPTDFPGYKSRPKGTCYNIVEYLEHEFYKEIGDSRFKPYLQIHEFEALLFVQPKKTADLFPGTNKLQELLRIKNEFSSPEEINDGETTAPSKRILKLFPNYEKPLYGAIAVIGTGLQNIRNECPHFNDWLTWLESLGQ